MSGGRANAGVKGVQVVAVAGPTGFKGTQTAVREAGRTEVKEDRDRTETETDYVGGMII